MAATIAVAVGQDKSGRVKTTHRLGSECARAEANTWRTFASAFTYQDGSGYIEVKRDGVTLARFDYNPE